MAAGVQAATARARERRERALQLRRLGRVHPVTIWGAAIVLVAWPVRILFGYSNAWQHFAQILIA